MLPVESKMQSTDEDRPSSQIAEMEWARPGTDAVERGAVKMDARFWVGSADARRLGAASSGQS